MTKPEAQNRWDETPANLRAGKKRTLRMATLRPWEFGLLSSFVIRASDFGLKHAAVKNAALDKTGPGEI